MKHPRSRILAAGIPYAAVLIGLYGLGNLWAAMGLYHLGAVAFLTLDRKEPGWRRLVQGWHLPTALSLFVLCVLNGPALYFLFPRAGLADTSLSARLAELGMERGSWLLLFVYYVSVTPWIEELFWRGRLGSPVRRLTASDILFGGYHVLVLARFLAVPWIALAFGALTGAGWLWRQVNARRGGLLVPALTHMAADASTMLAVYFLIR